MANQYAPPKAHLDDVAPPGGAITKGMIEALRGTKGWVLLIAVLLFIGAALSGIGGLMTLVAGGRFMGAEGPAGAVMGMGVVYIVSALIYFFLGLYLVKYSSAIGRLMASGRGSDMEDALVAQRKFWRLTGILAVITLVLMVVGILAAIAIPAYLGMGMRH